MPLKALATSFVVHLGVAAGIALGAGGHTSGGSTAPAFVEITLLPSPVTETPAMRSDDDVKAPVRGTSQPQPHTHAYPVPPSHDSQPHDPSVRHDGKPAHANATAAAEPAGTEVSAPAKEVMPTFALSANVASTAGQNAGGSGRPSNLSASPSAGRLGEETLGASWVDVPAKLLTSVTAAYPAAARSDEREADVGLEIVVDRDGVVVDARVVRSAGADFDHAALSAIRGYRFAPARHEGHVVRVRMPWTVQFRLR